MSLGDVKFCRGQKGDGGKVKRLVGEVNGHVRSKQEYKTYRRAEIGVHELHACCEKFRLLSGEGRHVDGDVLIGLRNDVVVKGDVLKKRFVDQ